jgi:hypothetical protein
VYTYSVKLGVRRDIARYVAGLLHAERRRRGTRRGDPVTAARSLVLAVISPYVRDTHERLGEITV